MVFSSDREDAGNLQGDSKAGFRLRGRRGGVKYLFDIGFVNWLSKPETFPIDWRGST
jgi:hypothetical protein